jgi:HEAT repeat protein
MNASIQNLPPKSHRRKTVLRLVIHTIGLSALFVVPLTAVAWPADKPTTADLLAKLKDKHKAVRLQALKALGELGTPVKSAIPDLAEALHDKDREVQVQAAQALAQIGREAVPALRDALKDESGSVRFQAAIALGMIALDAKEAIPALMEAARDKEPGVRISALKGLLAADAATSQLEPLLKESTKDQNPYVSLLGNMGLDYLDAKASGKRPAMPLNAPPILAAQRLTPDQEAQLDKLVDLFIVAESHDPQAIRRLTVPWSVAMQTSMCVTCLGPEAIPSLVRGIRKASALGYACAAGVLSKTLCPAIANCNDPQQIDYVIQNLGALGRNSVFDTDSIKFMLDLCNQRKTELLLMTIAAEKQAEFNRTVEKLMELSDAELLKVFKDKSADMRLAALTAAAAKRLHAEDDLIERLNDSDPRVVQLARQSLMRLSRGTDLGPVADAGQLVRQTSQKRWREWWSHQDQNPNATKTDDPPMVAVTSPGEDAAAAAKLVADLKDGDAADRDKALKALRETKGVAFTDALAGVVAKLDGEARDQARTALEDRLAKLSIQALHEKLLDADAEVRRAAAAAVGQKMDRAFAPELIALLSDGETDVAKAAQAALRSLSGEDFGPKDGADEKAQKEAIKKWRAWWTKMQDK